MGSSEGRRSRCRGRRHHEREFLHSLALLRRIIPSQVGKSSIINALSRKPSCPVYKLSSKPVQTPSTTMYPQEVTVNVGGNSILLIDTPGLFWEYPEEASKEDAAILKARDILLRSRGRIDHLKDPLPPSTGPPFSAVYHSFTRFPQWTVSSSMQRSRISCFYITSRHSRIMTWVRS